ncbi:MAG TPA: hypothetical protein VFL88_02855 [Gemmatimonadales bacterium]|nr:hypothetical protein [Gemmatimonadales bacterium]
MTRLVRLSLLIAAAGGAVALGLALRWRVTVPSAAASGWTESSQRLIEPADFDSLTRAIVHAAAFRERRTLAQVAFDPSQPAGAQLALPSAGPPKPAIQLVGIAWSREPVALLDGVPGVEGSHAMQRGDTAGGLRLRRISPREVVMTGYDTTWTLRLREFR